MRIVSLLRSATGTVCALAARGSLVGRSHACDVPAEVASLPALSSPRLYPKAPGSTTASRSGSHAGCPYFNRPGPRIVESLEILLGVLHPERTPTKGLSP